VTKFEDNISPYLSFVEGSAPSSPAATNFRLFYDSSDHLLKWKNSAGTVTAIATGTALTDQGVFTYLDGTVAAAPGTPASGKLRLYAKTGKVLAVKDDAGVETVLGAGGGGSDLVQTYAGSGSVYVPGLRGSPDALPASPNAADDEFEALSGWTTLGALDTLNVTDVPSHAHLVKTTGGQFVDGIYKASPSTPFTVTAKVSDRIFDTDYQMSGLMLLETSPGKLIVFGARRHSSFNGLSWERSSWTNRTTNAGADVDTTGMPTAGGFLVGRPFLYPYLRLVVTSSTSVTMQVSAAGLSWFTVYSAVNPGFTIGAVGLFLYSYAAVTNEAWFDWIRFT
jgi:hypothetical protein